ncbi:amidase, partial [Streptomyces rimosus]
HSEPLLISLAAQLEAELRWYERWPEAELLGERPEAAERPRVVGAGRAQPRSLRADGLGGSADAVGL